MTTDTASRPFVLPTPDGSASELTRDEYAALTVQAGLTIRSLVTIASGAQILRELDRGEALSLEELVARMRPGQEPESLASERRALSALQAAGLLIREGSRAQARYRRLR